jgi:alkanesulfonate monooxygenase SsuD/methylene tetrahydromethanopterin reductase-like flavin-dependent oxidoreductase (luciferase family)
MTIGIGIGLARFPFATGKDYFQWAELCELGGLDSIWQTDRLVSREPNLETLSTMAALAGATQRIRFGMNVASIALRDPLLTAKQCATIDRLSDGRLLPAFGIGSALSLDYRSTGIPTKRREKKLTRRLLWCNGYGRRKKSVLLVSFSIMTELLFRPNRLTQICHSG